MASNDLSYAVPANRTTRLDLMRSTLTGAVVAALLFAICWIGVFMPAVRVTHMYLQLFTAADLRSGTALAEGLCWSLIGGGAIGLLIALVYNALGAITRR